MEQLTHREKLDQMDMVCPAQNFTAREVFAMYHYMEHVFEDDVEKFFKGFGKEDDACWDEQASRSAHKKLVDMTNYCYEEGFVRVDDVD
tara:strand:- start:688 stop:954 length:267 start_codon:yes stop_codon:yes gene_type:complete